MFSPHNYVNDHDMRQEGSPPDSRAIASEWTMNGFSSLSNDNRTPNGRNNPTEDNQQSFQESPTSGDSWPEEEFAPFSPVRKRHSSPSILDDYDPKRHRAFYTKDKDEGQSRRSHSQSRLNNGQSQYGFDIAEARHSKQPSLGLGISDYGKERPVSGLRIDDLKDQYEAFRTRERVPANSNDQNRYARAQTQEPSQVSQRIMMKRHKTPERGTHRRYQELAQGNATADLFERQASQLEDACAYRRFSSVAPEVFRGVADRADVPGQQVQHYPVQAPQLGSPIWTDTREHQQIDAVPSIVRGHYVANEGHGTSFANHQGGQSAYQELDPRPPENHRARGRSVAPRTPASQRARSSTRQMSVHPGSQIRSRSIALPSSGHHRGRIGSILRTPNAVSRTQVTPKSNRQPQHVHAEIISDADDSPTMEELMRKARRTARTEIAPSSYDLRQVLPQHSMFSRNPRRPQPSATQIPQTARTPSRHAAIDLRSPEMHGEMRPPPSPVKPVPMRDRITPAKRPSGIIKSSLSKPNMATQNKPKPERTPKVEQTPQVNSAELERQKAHAEMILKKEEEAATQALQLEIFGEIVPEDAETKKKREEKERAENQRKREEAWAEKLMKQDEKRLAEMEKKRQQEEEAERIRRAKELDETKNKIRRDAETARQVAVDAEKREKLRQESEQLIKADREKKAAEVAEREREKERANRIQVDEAEFAKMKAERETKRKQIASLNVPKLCSTNERASIARNSSQPADNSDEASVDNQLFVSNESPPKTNDNVPQDKAYGNQYKVYDIDDRSQKIPNRASTAAENMAQFQSKASGPSYREQREAHDAQKSIDAMRKARDVLAQRYNKKQSAVPEPQPVQRASRPSQPPASRPAKPKSSASFGSAIDPPGLGGNTAISRRLGSQATPNLLSKSQHQNLMQEQKVRDRQRNAGRDARKIEEYNTRARQKRADKSREKQKQIIIDRESKNGIEISEEDLNRELNEFMENRERDLQQRAVNKEEKAKKKKMFPTFRSLNQGFVPLQPSRMTTNALGIDEDDSLEAQQRRAKEAAVREQLDATAKIRNGPFSVAAAKKDNMNFQLDAGGKKLLSNIKEDEPPFSESEEDPEDSVLTPDSTSDEEESSVEDSDESEVSEEDPDSDIDEGPIVKPVKILNVHNTSDIDAKILNGIDKESTEETHDPVSLAEPSSTRPHESEPETFFTFNVKVEVRKNGVDKEAVIKKSFSDREEANNFVKRMLVTRAKSNPDGFRQYYRDELRSGVVKWDKESQESFKVYIEKELRATREHDDFDPSKYHPRRDPESWVIRQTIHRVTVNKGTSEKENLSDCYIDLHVANNAAAKMFQEFFEPEEETLENLAIFENGVQKTIRETRDSFNNSNMPFGAYIDVVEDNLVYMIQQDPTLRTVQFAVERLAFKGPLN